MSQFTAGHSSIATVNPYTNELVREFPAMEESTIDQAVDAAHEAFVGVARHARGGARGESGRRRPTDARAQRGARAFGHPRNGQAVEAQPHGG